MRGADQLQPRHVEHSEELPPPEVRITVSEYLLSQLQRLDVSVLHTVAGMEETPLVACTHTQHFIEPIFWDSSQEAVWAVQQSAQCQGLGAIFISDHLIAGAFEGIVSGAYERLAILFILRRSLRIETKEVCGLPLSIQERGREEVRRLMMQFSTAHVLIDDRKSAASRIDRAIDTALELQQPSVIELPDELAQSVIPPHIHKKSVFNYEDQEIIKGCWNTVLSRLEQAHDPLFIIGHECRTPQWHQTLLALANTFHVRVMASQELWGHIESMLPSGFQGYFAQNSLQTEGLSDCLFVFGVPSDSLWLEMTITHHDLSYSNNEDLFCLNSSGVFFGDGRDIISAPCLKEFFAHSPRFAVRDWPLQTLPQYDDLPPWHALASMLKDLDSPLFVPRDTILLSLLLRVPPFAKIFIQPEESDDSWGTTSAICWSKIDISHTIFIAGNTRFLTRAFGCPLTLIPHNLVFLLNDSENTVEEISAVLQATVMTDEHDVEEWIASSNNPHQRPGLIWIS
jgi:hypothetical protein